MTGCNPEACFGCRQGRECESRDSSTDEWLVRCAMAAFAVLFVACSVLAEIFR
jgi:hypothetical protein